jgi:hypothetical protein
MAHFIRELMRWLDHMTIQHWLYLLAGVIVVGFMTLRGIGSRSQY